MIVRHLHTDEWWDLGGYREPERLTFTGAISPVGYATKRDIAKARKRQPIGFRFEAEPKPRARKRARRKAAR